MLHVSTNIGQSLKIQGVSYTLLATDQLNNGALLKVDRGEHSVAIWVFVGDEGVPLGRGNKLLVSSLYQKYQNSAKLSLCSSQRLNVEFPKAA